MLKKDEKKKENDDDEQLVHPDTADYTGIHIDLLESMLPIFTVFEESDKYWPLEEFLKLCNL